MDIDPGAFLISISLAFIFGTITGFLAILAWAWMSGRHDKKQQSPPERERKIDWLIDELEKERVLQETSDLFWNKESED